MDCMIRKQQAISLGWHVISSLIDAPGAVRYLTCRGESYRQMGHGCDTSTSHGTAEPGGATHEDS